MLTAHQQLSHPVLHTAQPNSQLTGKTQAYTISAMPHIHNLPSLPVTTWPPKAHCFIPFLPPHVGCQTPYTPTLMHVLRHDHLCRDQTATLPVFNYGFRRSNRAVAIATFKISQHSHPPPPPSKPSTISESTETYHNTESSFDGLGGA